MPCFYKDSRGQIIGPVSTADARKLVAQSVIRSETLVAQKPEGPWVAAGRLKGLFDSHPDANPQPAGLAQPAPRVASSDAKAPSAAVVSRSNPACSEAPQPHVLASRWVALARHKNVLLSFVAAVASVLLIFVITRSFAASKPSNKPPLQETSKKDNPTPSGKSATAVIPPEPEVIPEFLSAGKLKELFGELAADEGFEWPSGMPPFQLDEEAASVMATRPTLSLVGLLQLRPEVAKALCKQAPGGVLELDGVLRLTDGVAQELARYKGKTLSLRGIKTMSPQAANHLSQCTADINLGGLTELHADAVATLKKARNIRLPTDIHVYGGPWETVATPSEAEAAALVAGYAACGAAGLGFEKAILVAMDTDDAEAAVISLCAAESICMDSGRSAIEELAAHTESPDVKRAADNLLALYDATAKFHDMAKEACKLAAVDTLPYFRETGAPVFTAVNRAKKRFVYAMESPVFSEHTQRGVAMTSAFFASDPRRQ